MTDFSKLLTHPDKIEIVDKLINGDKPKDVATYLKLKYSAPNQKHLVLSATLLQEFVDSKLDLYGQLDKDIKDYKDGKFKYKEMSESLVNNRTYQQRLAELADVEIDLKKTFERMIKLMEQRFEQIFDRTQMNPTTTKNDHVLVKIHDSLMLAIDKYDKHINNRPDQVIQHNHSVQLLDQSINVFQDAVREVLVELSPEEASRFMELLSDKLEKLKKPAEPKPAVRFSDSKQLAKAVDAIEAEFEKTTESEVSNDAQ
jgi:hypothetical protein